jgi:hypothetical protein
MLTMVCDYHLKRMGVLVPGSRVISGEVMCVRRYSGHPCHPLTTAEIAAALNALVKSLNHKEDAIIITEEVIQGLLLRGVAIDRPRQIVARYIADDLTLEDMQLPMRLRVRERPEKKEQAEKKAEVVQ